MAFSIVLIMLAVPFTAVQLTDDDNDSDANPVISGGIRAGKYIATHWKEIVNFVSAFAIGWEVYDLTHPDPSVEIDDDELRKEEARLLARSLADGTAAYANSLNNYQNIWSLTSEHWIRQAELASSAYWVKGEQYSPYDILTYSSAYYNSAMMLVNATNQINEQFSTVAEHIGEWNASDCAQYYGDGRMSLTFSIGSESVNVTSADGFSARMGQVVGHGNDRTVKDGADAVYYVGGPVYASAVSTMTGENGEAIHLNKGWNWDLPAVDSDWKGYNVYRLTPGVTYFGNFMYVIETGAAPVEAGLMITSGSDMMIVSCDGSYLYDGTYAHRAVNDGGYDLFKLSVIPQNTADRQESDITSMMVYYALLNKQIDSVLAKTNQKARVVWNIYEDAGSASMYLTTLNVPDTYGNVVLTDEQQRMLVTLYMDQLSTWWDDYGGAVKKDSYYLTQDSMSLYCRGTLTTKGVGDTDGSSECVVYEGVAFTPIFYKTTTLRNGTNVVDSQCFVLIYGQCTSLSGFDAANHDDCELLYLGPGSTVSIAEMYHDGKPVQELKLVSSQIDYIKAEEMESFDPVEPHPTNDMAELFRLVFLIIGGAFVAYGLGRGNARAAVMGLVLILAGLLLAETVEDVLEEHLDWTFQWAR